MKNYQAIGRDDRDKNYFLQMYLADYRAIEYLASRPDWDGKTLVVMGISMGGQQSICAASLNPRVSAAGSSMSPPARIPTASCTDAQPAIPTGPVG